MARGERPIKLGNSWFSAKSIEVDRRMVTPGGRALDGLGGREPYQWERMWEGQDNQEVGLEAAIL